MSIVTYPLQSGPSCVAYSFATAIEIAYQKHPPQFHPKDPVDRSKLIGVIGAPASVSISQVKLSNLYTTVRFTPISSTAIQYPCVVATWRDGFSHAVCLTDDLKEYDPARGVVDSYGRDKMASHCYVEVVNPPVINKWLKYSWYRALIKLVEFIFK